MSKVIFDGLNKIITINSGITSIDVEIDLYSEWKKWVIVDPNSQWDAAFRTVGGDIIGINQFIPKYFFLINNWKVKAENLYVNFTTNLYSDNYLNPLDVINSSVIIRNSDVPGMTQLSAITYNIENIDTNINNISAYQSAITYNIENIDSGITNINDNMSNIDSEVAILSNNLSAITYNIENIDSGITNIYDNILNINSGISYISNNITAMENILKSILGLSQSNYKLVNHVYDSNSKLLTCNIKTYNNSYDCDNDINVFETYEMNAIYNSNGNLIDYKVVKI